MLNQSNSLLSDRLTRSELALELRCHPRTIARYESQTDGLPSAVIEGRKYYKIDTVRAGLARREHCPNPVRRGAA